VAAFIFVSNREQNRDESAIEPDFRFVLDR